MSVAVKICGFRDAEDMAALEAAIAGGARLVGFVFEPSSRRYADPDKIRKVSLAISGRILRVGLFVDASDAEIAQVIAKVPLDMLQLHGHETPERVAEVRRNFGLPVIKAIRVADATDAASARDYEGVADMLLFDAKVAGGVTGGTGKTFDWSLLSGADFSLPWLLAGGLNAGNLREAVAATGARMVDISSGAEDETGRKSAEKIREILAMAV